MSGNGNGELGKCKHASVHFGYLEGHPPSENSDVSEPHEEDTPGGGVNLAKLFAFFGAMYAPEWLAKSILGYAGFGYYYYRHRL